jgi:DNA-binding NarL/FixJ family response regulator
MIRVLIADDQGMMRAGLRSLLDGERDIEVVAEAGDGEEAVAAVRQHRPDVALLDIRMPKLDGIAATRLLVTERAATRILVLTTFDLDEYVFAALRAGASGFLLKDAPADDLVNAVRAIARGDALLDPAVTRRVIETFGSLPDIPRSAQLESLSPRELEVFELLARGKSNAEIAKTLYLGEATVKTHVSNVLTKLGLRDRVQAVIAAYETGLVRPIGPATDAAPERRSL